MANLFRLTISILLVHIAVSVGFGQGGSHVRNPLLECCTGTWCQWCPCGHTIIAGDILPNYPNTVVLSYHGPANSSSDPYSFFPGNGIIAGLGLNSYPTGNIDRTSSSPVSRSSWYSIVSSRSLFVPDVIISFTRTFSTTTRELGMIVKVTPQFPLSGTFMMSAVLLEDSLIYPQTGNASCPGGNPYVHNHVVRAMLNGMRGDTLIAGSSWPAGSEIAKTVTYTVPSNFVAEHCKLAVFVYKVAPTLNVSEVLQAEECALLVPTGVDDNSVRPVAFNLEQNYPNPFNPTTTIRYTIPQAGHVELSVLDVLGREVATLVDARMAEGVNEVSFDASNYTSGIYFYRLRVGDLSAIKKMVLTK